jgi:hypothetical protein
VPTLRVEKSRGDSYTDIAEQLILAEVEALVAQDNFKYPLKGAKEIK